MPLNDDDKALVEKLRKEVKDHITPYYDTDFNLLRWLKGHDNNFDVIVPKLLNHLKLRKSDWKLDELASKPRDHPVHQHWKSGLTGEAIVTSHTIVNIEQSGNNDYWGMLKTYPINEILRARVYDLESMLRSVMEAEERTGEQHSILYIMDLSNIVLDKRTLTLLTGALASISAFMTEHYVEMVHSFVLVNVPAFISTIWTIARPILPQKTRQKVNILGNNWKEEILKYADPSTLPAYWNDAGSDGPFTAPVERGLAFPEKFYYQKGVSPECKELLVPAGKTGYFDIHGKEGDRISWEVHANGHFAFCIFILDGTNDDVMSMERAYPLFSKVPGPTFVPCLDSIECPKTATYRFWFSNQHAWLHKLEIRHHVTVQSS